MIDVDFFINLKKDLQEISGGITKTTQGIWDGTAPNSSHRFMLKEVFNAYIRKAGKFGFYVVRRHGDCGLPSHKEEYVMEKIDGQEIDFKDPRFVWDLGIDQGNEETFCPCSSSHEIRMHWVLYDLVYEQSADSDTCKALDSIFCSLQTAIDQAGDHQPRSGIREAILYTIGHIDGAILAEVMEHKI